MIFWDSDIGQGGGSGAGTATTGDQNSGTAGSGTNAGGSGNQSGNEIPDWLDVFPEDAAKDPNITKFKTPDDFYKSFKTQNELIGRKGVIVPGKDAKPEDIDKFYNALGRPEKPEAYKLTTVENLHKSIQITPESTLGYQTLAHKHGLTQAQADGLNRDYLAIVNKSAIDQETREIQAAQQAEASLRQEWGSKFDTNRNMVTKGIMKAGGQEALDAMSGEKGLGNNPVVLKTLAKVFSLLSEDQINSIETPLSNQGSQGNETPEEAKQKIEKMMNDQKHPINDEKSPHRKEAIAERMRLYKIAYPDGGA